MNEKLRNHLDLLFENAPKTRKAFELKEELLANSDERYNDLIRSGITPEDAYKNVVNSIGDVSELFKGLAEVEVGEDKEANEIIKKLALIKSAAVGLYIFSFVILILFSLLRPSYHANFPVIGFMIMILIDIIPTCMLVYVSNVYPKYNRQADTVVEDFKEWKSETKKSKALKNSITSVLWTLTVLLYFAISFATWSWQVSWIIFLVAICAQTVIGLVFRLKEIKE